MCGTRCAIVVQHGCKCCGIDLAFVDEQHAQVRSPNLPNHEDVTVLSDEILNLVAERECTHTHRIEVQSTLLEGIERFMHGGTGGTVVDNPQPARLQSGTNQRLGNDILCRLEFAQQPLHIVEVI